ncbi:MAG: hypothetical protein GXO43_03810, partial [Crenarchaeota archaeon]|nr:hypothetical protein [Thermoproteota archaeon]
MRYLCMPVLVVIIIATLVMPFPSTASVIQYFSTSVPSGPSLLPGAPSNVYMTVDNARYLIGLNTIIEQGGPYYITSIPIINAAKTPYGLLVLLSNGTLIHLSQDMSVLWRIDTGYTEIMEPKIRVVNGYIIIYRSPNDYSEYMKIYSLKTGAEIAVISRQGVPSNGYTIAIGPDYIIELIATGSGHYNLAIYSIDGKILYKYSNSGSQEYPVAAVSIDDAALIFITVPSTSQLKILFYDGAANWYSVKISGSYSAWGAAMAEKIASNSFRAIVAIHGSNDTYVASIDLSAGGATLIKEYHAPRAATRYFALGPWIAYLSDQQHVVAINNGGIHTYVLNEPFNEPLLDVRIWCVNETWLVVANHNEKAVLIDTSTGSSTTIAKGVRLFLDGYHATVPARGVYIVSPKGLATINEMSAVKGYTADPFTKGLYYRVIVKLDGTIALQRISKTSTVEKEIVLGKAEIQGYAHIYRSRAGGYIYVAVPLSNGTELYIVDPDMNRVVNRVFQGADTGPYTFYEDNGHIAVIDIKYSDLIYEGTPYGKKFYTGLDPSKHYSYVVHNRELIITNTAGKVQDVGSHVIYAEWIAPGILAYITESYGKPKFTIYSCNTGIIYQASIEELKPIIGNGFVAIMCYTDHKLYIMHFENGVISKNTYNNVYDATVWDSTIYVSWLNGTVSRLGRTSYQGYRKAYWMPGPPVYRVGEIFFGMEYNNVDKQGVPTLLPYIEGMRIDIVHDVDSVKTTYNVLLHIRVINIVDEEPAAKVPVSITYWKNGSAENRIESTDSNGYVWISISNASSIVLETPRGLTVMYPLRPITISFKEDGTRKGYCTIDGYNYTHVSMLYGESYRIRYGIGAEINKISNPSPLYTSISGGVFRNATGWATASNGIMKAKGSMVLLSSGGSTAYLYLKLRTAWRTTLKLNEKTMVKDTEQLIAHVEAWYKYVFKGFFGT